MRLMLVADESRPTTVKTRLIATGQQIARADYEDNRPISDRIADLILDAYRTALKDCDIVIISDYNKGLFTDRVLAEVIETARAAAKPVLVDPKRVRLADYRGATLIKPNRRELAAATGHKCYTDADARAAADRVVAATGAMVLLTRSEQGMSLFRRGAEPVHQRTVAREVFDVSGAGDTVAAVVAVALAAGLDVIEAMRLANAAAGIVINKRGTATVTYPELVQALERSRLGFESRIAAKDTVLRHREIWRQQRLVCGFTNGCFDLIHPGHISLLKQAKAACDRLIVALNSDSSVRRLKGPRRPLQTQEARACVIAAMQHVDLVTIFDEDTPRDLIAWLKPDVLVKGADYREDQVVGADLVRSWGGRVVLAELAPEQSTTRLVSRTLAQVES
jgi:D-beta-D-heptose 7-phosphate kinase/D-beta-D-heptose 1-phosphate adenosyltransferase